MTFQCHYEFCLLGCQNKLIERYCSKRERGQAIELLTDYVTGKIEHTLRALEDVGKELLFPGFCHRLLPECYGFASTDNNSDSRFDPAIQLLSSSNDSMAKEGAI
uniref:Uncharacterized protein n=1 Tax=Plectus sambesii TaxID=2011161 RepID=A0A914WDL8_9BILA